jgi:hypothetical protein
MNSEALPQETSILLQQNLKIISEKLFEKFKRKHNVTP